jgi:hypothetical protein
LILISIKFLEIAEAMHEGINTVAIKILDFIITLGLFNTIDANVLTALFKRFGSCNTFFHNAFGV